MPQTFSIPSQRVERSPLGSFGYYRLKFHNGALYAIPHRVDRLVRDGGQMMLDRDYDRLWRALTDAIYCEREFYRRNHWSYDWNRHIGLHQARTWLRRERAAEALRRAA